MNESNEPESTSPREPTERPTLSEAKAEEPIGSPTLPLIDRAKAMSWQGKLFIALGAALLVLGLTGQFTARGDVDLTQQEAVEIGRTEVPFEPENADARLVRQGFGLRPVWAISYSIPSADEDEDFEQHTTVEIDGNTGEILRVITAP